MKEHETYITYDPDLAVQANPITGKASPLEPKAKTREGRKTWVDEKGRNVDG